MITDEIDQSRIDELKAKTKEVLEKTDLYQYKGTVSKLLGLRLK